MPERDWPFDQPRNTASITLRSIVFGDAPILHVTHDEDDHGWQFLGLEDACDNDACVVGLGEIVARDPSVIELADLPPGWHAWRSSSAAPWQRAPNPREDHSCSVIEGPGIGRTDLRIPYALFEKANTFPESSYGATTVTVILADGRRIEDVVLGGAEWIVKVGGQRVSESTELDFAVGEIVDVIPQRRRWRWW